MPSICNEQRFTHGADTMLQVVEHYDRDGTAPRVRVLRDAAAKAVADGNGVAAAAAIPELIACVSEWFDTRAVACGIEITAVGALIGALDELDAEWRQICLGGLTLEEAMARMPTGNAMAA